MSLLNLTWTLLALSTSALAEPSTISITCKDGNKIVAEVVADIETGEKNSFIHYGNAKPTSLVITHLEGDPEAMRTEKAMLEVYASNESETSTALLTLMTPKGSKKVTDKISTAGALEFNDSTTDKLIKMDDLTCEVKNSK